MGSFNFSIEKISKFCGCRQQQSDPDLAGSSSSMARSNLISTSLNPCATSSSAASIPAGFRQSSRQDQQRAATFFFGVRCQIEFVQWSQQLEKKPITGLSGTVREFVTSSVVEIRIRNNKFWACTSPYRIQALRGKKISATHVEYTNQSKTCDGYSAI
jgi:hypothetical protein